MSGTEINLPKTLADHALWRRGKGGSRASLRSADLARARLAQADLAHADLAGADLRGADLADACLTKADLTRAYLLGADLAGSNLAEADLTGAYLRGADFTGSNLAEADLTHIKNDFLAAVLWLPNELDALRSALISGKIDGSTYSGKCACLAGTLARARGISGYNGEWIGNFHTDSNSPREMWFTGIKPGNMPETNQVARIALEWTEEAIMMRDAIRRVGA